MTTHQNSRPFRAVNCPPPTLWDRIRRPVLAAAAVGAVAISGPLAGAMVVGTLRMMLWMADCPNSAQGLLASCGAAAAALGWIVAVAYIVED